MNAQLPQTDSIQELASFWEAHELTEFDDQLEEVQEPVFETRGPVLHVPLTAAQAQALDELAKSRGVNGVALIQQWIEENVHAP